MDTKELEKVWAEPKENMTAEEMTADILTYIKMYDYVSFAELRRRYGEQAKGNMSLGPSTDTNIVYFMNMSDVFVSSIKKSLKEKKIHIHPAQFLTYLVDGECLRLPIAQRVVKGGYKKLHWLPICFRSGPFCMSKECPVKK